MTQRDRRILAWCWTVLLVSGVGIVPAADGSAKELPLPSGPTPVPLALPYFASPSEAFVFRNWGLLPASRLAHVLAVDEARVRFLAEEMGLAAEREEGPEFARRGFITLLRRNWHLLSVPQLLELLEWTEGRLGYTLREDDFLWIKLGNLKPLAPPLRGTPEGGADRREAIRGIVRDASKAEGAPATEPRFAFLDGLAGPEPERSRRWASAPSGSIDLGDDWALRLPADPPAGLASAAERFARGLRGAFGVRVAVLGQGDSSPGAAGLSELRLEPLAAASAPGAPGAGSESHEIEVSPGRVSVRASALEGFLAAFRTLRERLEEAGGPHLAPGLVRRESRYALRHLHSYFALYGDALLEPGLDPYPDGYLERLSALGVNGVWLPVLLRSVAPQAAALGLVPGGTLAEEERRLRVEGLRDLARRARARGIGVMLYLNEPRALPRESFREHPELKGVDEGVSSSLCTSEPAVREWIRDSVAHVAREVPELEGFFTITASENLTHCWSHGGGAACPRCASRNPGEVAAQVNALVSEGVRAAGSRARVVAWDWGWASDWVESAIAALPKEVALQSVSEWSLPISRGGVPSEVGEYSISAVGPGPRAKRHWALARARGLACFAKIQAGNTWELSSVPYIPAVGLVAEHARRLAECRIDGIQLGWTLGGFPSPNLEAVGAYAFRDATPGAPEAPPPVEDVLRRIALRRFGPALAPRAVEAWRAMSRAFEEYPYHIGSVYSSCVQMGPANPLYPEATGYRATMVGIPYDDLESWRAVYPAEVFAAQFELTAALWRKALPLLRAPEASDRTLVLPVHLENLAGEGRVAEAAELHFRSVAAQCRFILARGELAAARASGDSKGALRALDRMEAIALAEADTARELLAIARADSRIGYEASNQYYYLPRDLLEKLISCRWIVETWIPGARGMADGAR